MTDLRIRDLTVEYARGDHTVRAIDGLDLDAASGELILLLGPSGCGKSTLLSCLAGILRPTSGSISLRGLEVTALEGPELIAYRRDTVGMVFQSFNLIPSLSAQENVEAPLRVAGVSARRARARAKRLLEMFDMSARAGHRPADMSGGQQQRVAIARALAHDPPLVLADEPTAHLDHVQVDGVLRALRELAGPGRIVVVATHDERMLPIADKVVDLVQLAADPEPERLMLEPGEVLFTHGARADLIYIVERGEICVERERADGVTDVVARFGPGRYLGELGPLLRIPRSATARARKRSVVAAYSLQQFRAAFATVARASALETSEKVVRLPAHVRPRERVQR